MMRFKQLTATETACHVMSLRSSGANSARLSSRSASERMKSLSKRLSGMTGPGKGMAGCFVGSSVSSRRNSSRFRESRLPPLIASNSPSGAKVSAGATWRLRRVRLRGGSSLSRGSIDSSRLERLELPVPADAVAVRTTPLPEAVVSGTVPAAVTL